MPHRPAGLIRGYDRYPSTPLRVATDLSILRHGISGTATWALGLSSALARLPDVTVRGWQGPRRRRRGGYLRKLVNALQDRAYYEILLARSARAWGADVMLMPANLSAARTRIPQLVTILDVNFLLVPDTYDPWYRRYATRMFARSVREADALATISRFSRDQICRFFGRASAEVEVIYPGLEPASPLDLLPPIPEPYALFFGPTEPHKNVSVLLQAWSLSPPPGVRLAIVGKPGRAHEEVLRAAQPLGDRVAVVGSVSDLEREAWYRGATMFLFPSRAEGFGYPPLEAMQREVPVIAADAGSLPEVLGDAALYHHPSDVDTLRTHIDRLLNDRALRASLVAAGLERASRYTWNASAEKVATRLRQLARREGAQALQ